MSVVVQTSYLTSATDQMTVRFNYTIGDSRRCLTLHFDIQKNGSKAFTCLFIDPVANSAWRFH